VDYTSAAGWAYDEGCITADMIQKHMRPSGKNTQILLCAPPAMTKFAVMPDRGKFGYTKHMFLQW
jgi:NAD(P)H-flavin reductase